MGERKRDGFDTELVRELAGSSAEYQDGAAAGKPLDLQLLPGNATADAGAQCFGAGLFCGEAGSEAFRTAAFALTIADFVFGIDTAEEAFAVAFNGLGDALYLDKIDAAADQHADHITMVALRVISRRSACDRKGLLRYLSSG